MLGSTKVCQTLCLVFKRKRVVNDSSATLTSNAQTNQNSYCWQVALDEVRGSIQGINPDDCILSVEGLKKFALDLVSAVSFLKAVYYEFLSLSVVLVEELS